MALYPEVKNVSFIQLTITPFVKITTTNSLVGGTGLVSNIGGGLGLALGLSILSVMDYFLEKITVFSNKNYSKAFSNPSFYRSTNFRW